MNDRLIPIARPDLSGNEALYVQKCLKSSWISSKGEFIDKFEYSFAKYHDVKFAVATSNGTTALHLALVALGIKTGDEILLPALTFVACANVVKYVGAQPVFVDVAPDTWNINPSLIVSKITPRTKAIMVVHLYGHPADLRRIIPIAKKYKLKIIEDAAEAHGAEIEIKHNKWQKVGSIGDVGCFSFYGNKIITTGEGGMLITNNKHLAIKARILRDHGQHPKRHYFHPVIGFNYRLTNLQAALGLAQLERINKLIERKRKIAYYYDKYLKDIPGIALSPRQKWTKGVCWIYSILIAKPYASNRNALMRKLKKDNIETRPFFYSLNKLPPYQGLGHFRQSEYLSRHGINLPSGYDLSKKDQDFIIKQIRLYSQK